MLLLYDENKIDLKKFSSLNFTLYDINMNFIFSR